MSGTLVRIAGILFVIDGIGSILLSTDQRIQSNLGRAARAAIGAALVITGGKVT